MQTTPHHFHKTRIAPTPSGFLHLGNAYSFVLTATIAKETGAEILLRIDDLDRERANKLYIQDIFDTLNFLEIPFDDGPRNMQAYEAQWSQIHRMPIYSKALQQLKLNGEIFACQCSRTQVNTCTCRNKTIPLDTENVSWRLHTNHEREFSIKTLNNGIIQAKLPIEMKDLAVKKKDGYPAYQLTSMVDDLYYGVDLVVRGEDLWPSTIAQHYLAEILQLPAFQKITFHHHPLLMGSMDKKLSKSAGATSIKYLREQGKTVSEVYKEIGGMIDVTRG